MFNTAQNSINAEPMSKIWLLPRISWQHCLGSVHFTKSLHPLRNLWFEVILERELLQISIFIFPTIRQKTSDCTSGKILIFLIFFFKWSGTETYEMLTFKLTCKLRVLASATVSCNYFYCCSCLQLGISFHFAGIIFFIYFVNCLLQGMAVTVFPPANLFLKMHKY